MTSLPIQLPQGFIPSITQDDQVIVGQTIASKKGSDEEIINIPQALSIKRSSVKKVLKKSPGEQVTAGDIIALKKSLFGTKSILLKSRVSGIVTRYERDSGNLVIKTSSSTQSEVENLISPVDGKVILCNNREIVLDIDKNALIGSKATGGKGEGEVFRLEADDPYHLDARTIGKIVLGGKFEREMLLKGIGIGVAGLIGTEIQDEDIAHISEKNFQTPIIEITEQDLGKLIEWAGKKVFLDAKNKSIIFLHN